MPWALDFAFTFTGTVPALIVVVIERNYATGGIAEEGSFSNVPTIFPQQNRPNCLKLLSQNPNVKQLECCYATQCSTRMQNLDTKTHAFYLLNFGLKIFTSYSNWCKVHLRVQKLVINFNYSPNLSDWVSERNVSEIFFPQR